MKRKLASFAAMALAVAATPAAAQDYWNTGQSADSIGVIDVNSIDRMDGGIVEADEWYVFSTPRAEEFYAVGGTTQYDCDARKYRLVVATARGSDGSITFGPERTDNEWADLIEGSMGEPNFELACGEISLRDFREEHRDMPDDLPAIVVTVRVSNSIENALDTLEVAD